MTLILCSQSDSRKWLDKCKSTLVGSFLLQRPRLHRLLNWRWVQHSSTLHGLSAEDIYTRHVWKEFTSKTNTIRRLNHSKLEGHSVECMYLRQKCFDGWVNENILKLRIAAAVGRANTYTWDFPDAKFHIPALYNIAESNPFPASGL